MLEDEEVVCEYVCMGEECVCVMVERGTGTGMERGVIAVETDDM